MYKKIVNVITGIFVVVMFVCLNVNCLKIPTNENKELLKSYCDEVAYTLDNKVVDEEFTIYLTADKDSLTVRIKDETDYAIKAEYPIVNVIFEGEAKSFEVDFENASYTEEVGNGSPYTGASKARIVFTRVAAALVASLLLGWAFWLIFSEIITDIIWLIKNKRSKKQYKQ